jgi:hypothetical protein
LQKVAIDGMQIEASFLKMGHHPLPTNERGKIHLPNGFIKFPSTAYKRFLKVVEHGNKQSAWNFEFHITTARI